MFNSNITNAFHLIKNSPLLLKERKLLFNSVLRFYRLRFENTAIGGSTSLKYPACRIMIPSKVKNYA
jgi:hypothetical protein